MIRRFKNDEVLRIGLYDLLGRLSLEQIQTQLSDLAEVVMERTLLLAAGMILGAEPGPDDPLPLAVISLGKLAGESFRTGRTWISSSCWAVCADGRRWICPQPSRSPSVSSVFCPCTWKRGRGTK